MSSTIGSAFRANHPDRDIHTSESGAAWEYIPDENGNLHRWYAQQPPIALTGADGEDAVTSAGIQVPQSDFSVEWLVLADDYSTANMGLGGQYITGGNLRAWSARVDTAGTLTAFASGDGSVNTNLTTSGTLYDAGVVDGCKAWIQAAFTYGATVEVAFSAAAASGSLLGHTNDRGYRSVGGALTLPYAALANLVVPLHLGSRFRNNTGAADGRETFVGTVEAMIVTVGSTVVGRFPNPAAGESWSHSGAELLAPPPFRDKAPTAVIPTYDAAGGPATTALPTNPAVGDDAIVFNVFGSGRSQWKAVADANGGAVWVEVN